MSFKVGDKLLWTSTFEPTITYTCTFLRYERHSERIVANNWSDSPDNPEKEDRCKAENFRLLTPLEEALL